MLPGPAPIPLYAGRIISIIAFIALSVIAFSGIRTLGGSRSRAAFGAVWLFATFNVAFMGYVGMNDPQPVALALMAGGFVWFVRRLQAGKAVEPAVLVMVAAGFFKHNMAAIPLSALIWLAMDNPKRALRAAGVGLLAAGVGLLACYAYYGENFIQQLLFPRALNLGNVLAAPAVSYSLLAALVPVLLWLGLDWKNRVARKMAVFLALALASGLVQRTGDGVDLNAYFEFVFALALGLGLAFGQAPEPAGRIMRKIAAARPAFALLLLPMIVLCFPKAGFSKIRSGDFSSEIAENTKTLKREIDRIRKMPEKTSCTVMIVCYWAGKPFVWDGFALKQRVVTGKWTEMDLSRRARAKAIRFVQIKDGTEWCDVWPCPSTLRIEP